MTEARTQLLLLALSRAAEVQLREIFTSPAYNEGLSNHLSASVDRIRFLGMIVAEAISHKIDTEKTRLQFRVKDTEDPTAEQWRSLIDVDDGIYPLKELQGGIVEEVTESAAEQKPVFEPAEEIPVDEEENADVDLPIYPIPESDAEDSDDDPTLVPREKITTPLYESQFTLLIPGTSVTS